MSNNYLDLVVPYRWLLGLTLCVWAVLLVLDAPLRNDAAPLGIVSLELAGTGQAAQRMWDSWSHQQQLYAVASLGIDYLFLVLYPLAISLACRYLAMTRETASVNVGLALARLQLLAGPLDAVENAALLMELFDSENMNRYAGLARWCAVPKFIIIAAGLLYIAIGFSKQTCVTPSSSGLHHD